MLTRLVGGGFEQVFIGMEAAAIVRGLVPARRLAWHSWLRPGLGCGCCCVLAARQLTAGTSLPGGYVGCWLVAAPLALAVLGFLVGGLGLFIRANWRRTAIIGAAEAPVLIYLLLWNGRYCELPDQGRVSLLISLGILTVDDQSL